MKHWVRRALKDDHTRESLKLADEVEFPNSFTSVRNSWWWKMAENNWRLYPPVPPCPPDWRESEKIVTYDR